MKAYKPQDCDFLILNFLNEYNSESLAASILQDAEERQQAFGDDLGTCIGLAQTFSNAVLTQTGRVLANEGLVEEILNKVEKIPNSVDFKLTDKGREIWEILERQFHNDVQKPGWTKKL